MRPSHYAKKTYCSRECMKEDYKKLFSGSYNPNYRAKEKDPFVCIICSAYFLPKDIYRIKKTCSTECLKKYLSQINAGHPVTAKQIAKQKETIRAKKIPISKKLICKCGGVKERKSKTCKFCLKSDSLLRTPIKCSTCKNCGNTLKYRYKIKLFCNLVCRSNYKKINDIGSKNPNWKGGKTPINQRSRTHKSYREWRDGVYKRDKYTCVDCGQVGGKLNAHHIKHFSTSPELRLVSSNGKTVCIKCHQKYHPNLIIKTGTHD